MLRLVAALLLFALMAPLAAADSEHSQSGEHRQDDQHRQGRDCSPDCGGKDTPPADPAPAPEEQPSADPSTDPQPNQQPPSDSGSKSDSGQKDSGPIGGLEFLGQIGPKLPTIDTGLPIPSCEPWLILGTKPTVRPECLFPSGAFP
jgi:hypothetical protein